MAKRFSITPEGIASYAVSATQVASLDLVKSFTGWIGFPKNVQEALIFSLKTALRNSTAGKMETDLEKAEAFSSIQKRCTALESGAWSARREGGSGEGRESVLARAIAFLQETTVAEAIAFLDEQIAIALEAVSIDPDAETDSLTDEEKTLRAKTIRGIKKVISDDPGVALKMAALKMEDAIAKNTAVAAAAAGKVSIYAKVQAPTETPKAEG